MDTTRGIVMVDQADVAALNGVPSETEQAPDEQAKPRARRGKAKSEESEAQPFISEGMRQDIETHGWAVDPNTGKKITRE